MNNIYWRWGFFFGGLAVILGAFAAHSLKSVFPPESLSVFETGVRYQFYHAFAVLVAALLIDRNAPNRFLVWGGRSFIGGIFLFSGSLYFLAAIKAGRLNLPEGIGIVTPIGGLLFIAGWTFLLIATFKR